MPAVAAAVRFATRRGLPSLAGSPAQVEWAEEVRTRLVKSFDQAIRSAPTHPRSVEMQQLCEWALTHTSAAWWIRQRAGSTFSFVRLRNLQALEGYARLMGKTERSDRLSA